VRETVDVESDTVATAGAAAAVTVRSRFTYAIKTEEPSWGGMYYSPGDEPWGRL
jgi:hypothetical protein